MTFTIVVDVAAADGGLVDMQDAILATRQMIPSHVHSMHLNPADDRQYNVKVLTVVTGDYRP